MEKLTIKPRLINKEKSVRTQPMKVLALGMPRTGTLSLCSAFRKLGYTPYHGTQLMKRCPNRNLNLWNEAMRAKFEDDGATWGRREFDILLGDFDAITDGPACFFAEELIAAYPEAKVVLTIRDVDKWLASTNATIFHVITWPSWRTLSNLDHNMILGPWYTCYQTSIKMMRTTVTGKDDPRQTYLEHYDRIRKLVPQERLLEFHAKDGWGPLCTFLGCEIPGGEYPYVNDSKDFISLHVKFWLLAIVFVLLKYIILIGLPLWVTIHSYRWILESRIWSK